MIADDQLVKGLLLLALLAEMFFMAAFLAAGLADLGAWIAKKGWRGESAD